MMDLKTCLFYQPKLDTLELKKRQRYWLYFLLEIKQIYHSNLNPLYTAFLHSIKCSEHRIRMKFGKDPLAVEQSNYLNKIVNFYIVYNLDV